ncbi:MAG: Hsp20/alpha crystallin family protein [Clostridia bacterium]|nr:Hsp20/alpha crystallin family protein [Clostridia bacterium]
MLVPRRNDFDLFDDMFSDLSFRRNEMKVMRTDLKEMEDKYVLHMDLPGYEKENIKLDIENGYLTISASMNREVNDSKDEKYIHKERYVGNCSRTFYVGDGVSEEDIKANFKNGTLTIEMPKVKTELIDKKKHIEIGD